MSSASNADDASASSATAASSSATTSCTTASDLNKQLLALFEQRISEAYAAFDQHMLHPIRPYEPEEALVRELMPAAIEDREKYIGMFKGGDMDYIGAMYKSMAAKSQSTLWTAIYAHFGKEKFEEDETYETMVDDIQSKFLTLYRHMNVEALRLKLAECSGDVEYKKCVEYSLGLVEGWLKSYRETFSPRRYVRMVASRVESAVKELCENWAKVHPDVVKCVEAREFLDLAESKFERVRYFRINEARKGGGECSEDDMAYEEGDDDCEELPPAKVARTASD